MFLQIITAISDFLWGTPMTVARVGTGLYLGIRFGFRYNFRKVGFNFRNTFGKMFQKGEGTGTVSGFAAACTAMANTIGVGNIGGVATAIVSGGPGAVFWMWVSGLLGMSTKACEIILGQRYRVKYSESMDELHVRPLLRHEECPGLEKRRCGVGSRLLCAGPLDLLRPDRVRHQLSPGGLRH